tara:strand:+ start:356 stop:523 length:168 start_codon:yes stop_codon:yes gene_type:complete
MFLWVVAYAILHGSDCGISLEELDVNVPKGQKMADNVCFEVGVNETDFLLNYGPH